MRIAVACDGLSIAPYFVQCSSYMCYTIENDIVTDSRNIPAFDLPLDQLPGFFHAIEANILMTGVIEEALVSIFENNRLEVVRDMAGDPLTAVRSYIAHKCVPTN